MDQRVPNPPNQALLESSHHASPHKCKAEVGHIGGAAVMPPAQHTLPSCSIMMPPGPRDPAGVGVGQGAEAAVTSTSQTGDGRQGPGSWLPPFIRLATARLPGMGGRAGMVVCNSLAKLPPGRKRASPAPGTAAELLMNTHASGHNQTCCVHLGAGVVPTWPSACPPCDTAFMQHTYPSTFYQVDLCLDVFICLTMFMLCRDTVQQGV